jgi:dihydrofolate synthase/folylpolyglutamate synthase
MSYEETCEYLFNQTTNFEKQGNSGYKFGLDAMLAIDEYLGHPHQNYKTIHIGGTNGKGSVSHTVAAQLQVCGYRVGLYTSPHLIDFSERIKVNGKPIDKEYVVDFVSKGKDFFQQHKATFFDITTAMAFKYFNDMDVDIAVIEVGLGGRLDSTNIITPLVSVITNISLEHTQQLGSMLEQIALEKAGIIKKNVPVVIGEALPETRPVFDAIAQELNAPITYACDNNIIAEYTFIAEGGIHYKTTYGLEFKGELSGAFQVVNTNTAINVLRQLMKQHYLCQWDVEANSSVVLKEIEMAFQNVCSLTGFKGRWQTVKRTPTVICDSGHNVGAWRWLSQQLAEVKCNQMHIIFGMMEDKDVYNVMSLLPKNATYYFTKSSSKRAMSELSLQVFGTQLSLSGLCFPTVAEAYHEALKNASPDDFIFVGGSCYIVADFLKTAV